MAQFTVYTGDVCYLVREAADEKAAIQKICGVHGWGGGGPALVSIHADGVRRYSIGVSGSAAPLGYAEVRAGLADWPGRTVDVTW